MAMGVGLRPTAKAVEEPLNPKARAPRIYPDREHSRRVGDLGGFVSPLRSPIIVVSRHYLDKGNEHGEAPTWP
jgi:hypothetical protein